MYYISKTLLCQDFKEICVSKMFKIEKILNITNLVILFVIKIKKY